MAQVTYRGVKYDTARQQSCNQNENVLSYRGTKYTKQVVTCK